MSAQEQLARHLTRQLLDEHYVIIDKSPAADQVDMMREMDDTSQPVTDTLLMLAEMAWTEFLENPRHRTFV
jgi:hypothetical protein